jgi:hypothetical protein
MPVKHKERASIKTRAKRDRERILAALRRAGENGITKSALARQLKQLTGHQLTHGLRVLRDSGEARREGSRRMSRYYAQA